MIQLIAVHLGGALPVVMELDTDGLNFVHRHALEHLPRSPNGVPELRGLAKADGALQFKFKIAPEKVAPGFLPELLALWDGKFTEATLKLIAKKGKAERDAASAAGLWKDGVQKGDLNAMHQSCTPTDAQVFQEKLENASGQAKDKARARKASKRIPKPKLLDAVIEATTTVNVMTGERVQIQSAAESAVTTLNVQSVLARVNAQVKGADDDHDRQEFADPLVEAKTHAAGHVPQNVPVTTGATAPATAHASASVPASVQASGPNAGQESAEPAVPRAARAKAPRLVEMSAQDLFKHLDKGTPGVFSAQELGGGGDFNLFDHDTSATKTTLQNTGVNLEPKDKALQAMQCVPGTPAELSTELPAKPSAGSSADMPVQPIGTAVEIDCSGIPDWHGQEPWDCGAERSEMGSNDYHAEFDPFVAFDGKAAAGGQGVATGGTGAQHTDHGQIEQSGQADSSRVTIELMPTGVDWTGLVSFRLDNHRSDARAVTLQSGEMFEALGYLQVVEPLAVKVQWLVDAVGDGDMVTQDVEPLRAATDWLRAELDWRSQELVRWLGKNDLVTPAEVLKAVGTHAQKAQRVGNAKKRPDGWVAAGCQLAALAQAISLDIAMLDFTVRDIERSLEGMPQWAIDVMQNVQAFSKLEDSVKPAVSRSAPGAVFRDVWREELQRIDRWCAAFAAIKIARQIGLFGQQPTDHKLLVRLEELIERARSWRAAPAQASRVLAVWVAFVLSLDHDNRPAQLVTEMVDANVMPSDKCKAVAEPLVDSAATAHRPRRKASDGRSRRNKQPAQSSTAEINLEEALHA